MVLSFPKINLLEDANISYRIESSNYIFAAGGKVYFYDNTPKNLIVQLDPLALEKYGPKEEPKETENEKAPKKDTPYLETILKIS